jgi:hypothetical protein
MFNSRLVKLALLALFIGLPLGASYGTAYTIDLGNSTSSVSINGALFNFDNISSGSGTYTDMFRIQKNGTELGYNYDGASAAPFDQVGGVGNPHQLLNGIPVVTINGVQYMRLNFDANNADNLTLTDFRMYVHTGGSTVLVSATANLSNLGTLVYDFNAGGAPGTNSLKMINFPSGSGTDNMSINIPLSVLNGYNFNPSVDNVYFFATMTNATSGFEEFAIDKSQPVVVGSLVPEAHTTWGGAALAILGMGGIVVANHRRRKAGAEAVV